VTKDERPQKVAYTLAEAAEATGLSRATLHRAIHTTDPRSFPPPMWAKRAGTDGRGKYLIPAKELERWVESLPDA
jgi:hypothetical protein